jgi:predicted TPR repeat methyltransferase
MNQLETKLERAQRHVAAGEFGAAAAIYQEVLDVQPDHPQALSLLSGIALRFRQADLAAELAAKAVAASPGDAAGHLNLGAALSVLGRGAEAESVLRRAIELKPDLMEAHFNLALELGKQGRRAEAVESYRKCLAFRADFAPGHNALAAALQEAGEIQDAMRHFRQAIQCDPRLAEAHYNLGVLHARQNQWHEAAACYKRAAEIRPDFREALRNLAALLAERREWKGAADAYRRLAEISPEAEHYCALAGMLHRAGARGPNVRVAGVEEACRQALCLNPELLDAHILLISLLVAEHRTGEAQAAIRDALQRHPESAIVRFFFDALSGGASRTAPAGFVTALFDDYAATFDEHLVNRLHYRGPEYLRQAVGSLGPRKFDVLDLGCGTGLCGVEFRDIARRMAGVDLAPAMIEAARRRGIYDDLRQQDVVDAVRSRRGEFDLLLGGDLFIYVGDLEPVFAAAGESLPPRGLLAFTAEKREGAGYQLLPTFRFAHSLAYVRECAARHGLREVYLKEEVLRIESGVPAMAWIVVLEKAG